MNVEELEDKAWDLDGVRIVVRAPGLAQVIDYTKQNAADQRMSVTDYIKTRIQPCVTEFDVVVIDGHGDRVHGRTKLKRVRDSYT